MKSKVTCNGFATVALYMDSGEKVYAEIGSCIASSPIYQEETRQGGLKRRRLTVNELAGKDYTPPEMPTKISQGWANFLMGTKQTMDRQKIGEPSYVLYEALENKQFATFRSCFPGEIMAWDVSPLEDGECYLDSSKPHGTIIAVRRSFLVADIRVSASVYHTGDLLVRKHSETNDAFQKLSGMGEVFLEVHGDLQKIYLHPGESIDVFPGYLLGFTDGMTVKMHVAGDIILRNEENIDYVIHITAGDLGGYVFAHSVRPRDFLGRKSD